MDAPRSHRGPIVRAARRHSRPPGPLVLLARTAARGALRLTGTRVRVHGELAPSGPAVLVANHGSWVVERWDHEQGVADAARLADLTRAGRRLAVFPEGGLSTLPRLRPFHLGGFAAAAGAGVRVVPVAVRGTRWILRPGRLRLRRGAVDIIIGAAIEPTGIDWHAAVQLRDSARAHILRHCGEPDLT